jgi:polysaccharide deacetylase 2 family uncharacterized protein YibQ
VGDEFTRVRAHIFWLAVIALALAAIAGGYLSGNASAPQLHAASKQPRVSASIHAVLHDPSDASVRDTFSEDDVVVDRSQRTHGRWLHPDLSVVVGLCGSPSADDAAFMEVKAPVAFDVDPTAAQAAEVISLARQYHDVVLLHLDRAPTLAELARLRKRFGAFDGIASRSSYGFVQALDGMGLLFFDERGDADADDFSRAGIPIVQRDETVDDRTARSYIRFMLARAIERSSRDGRSVVFMRPQEHSLDELQALVATRSVQFTALTPSE